MYKHMIAGLTALSLTLFSAPAPASALTEDDVGKLIGGALTLFVLGKIIEDAGDDKSDKKRARVHKPHKPHHGHAHKPKKPRFAPLPAHCIRINDSHSGPRRYFPQRCLSKHYPSYTKLPESCSIYVKAPHGLRKAYGARCLRERGIQVAHR